MKKILLILSLFFFVTGITIGQTNKENMVYIPVDQLTEQQKNYVQTKELINTTSDWVGLGNEIGEAINGAAGAITKHAVEFSKTELGVYTMILIAYKVVGTDLIQLLIGIPLLFFVIAFGMFFYYNKVRRYRYLRRENKEGLKEYDISYGYDEGESFFFFIAWAVFIGLTLGVIFAG